MKYYLFPLEIKRLTEFMDEILVELNDRKIDEIYNDEQMKLLLQKFYDSKIVETNLEIYRVLLKGFINDYRPKNTYIILEPFKDEIELPESSKTIRHYIISNLVLDFFPILLYGYESNKKMGFSKIADFLTSLRVVEILSQKLSYTPNVMITLTNQFENNWYTISEFYKKFNEESLNFIFKEEISKFSGKLQAIIENSKERYFFAGPLRENIQNDHYNIIKAGNLGENLSIPFSKFLGTESLNNYGFGYFDNVFIDKRNEKIYTAGNERTEGSKNVIIINRIFKYFSRLFQMYQYLKYREYLMKQSNFDFLLGAHNIQIQKGEDTHELDLIFYNTNDDKIEFLIECTLSCDEGEIKNLGQKVSFIKGLGIQVEKSLLRNPLQEIDLNNSAGDFPKLAKLNDLY